MIKDQYEIEINLPVKFEITVEENTEHGITHWCARAKGIKGLITFTDNPEELEKVINDTAKTIFSYTERNHNEKLQARINGKSTSSPS